MEKKCFEDAEIRFGEWPRRLPEGTKADCSLAINFSVLAELVIVTVMVATTVIYCVTCSVVFGGV